MKRAQFANHAIDTACFQPIWVIEKRNVSFDVEGGSVKAGGCSRPDCAML